MVPGATAAALPAPVPLRTGATFVSAEDQATCAFKARVLPSAKWPVAVKLCELPSEMGFDKAGATVIDSSVGPLTVSSVDPKMLPRVAAMVVAPAASACARPRRKGRLLMAATAGSDELQVTSSVRSRLLPSKKLPVAVKARMSPVEADGLAGVTAIETRPSSTVSVVESLRPR